MSYRFCTVLSIAAFSATVGAQVPTRPPNELPPTAAATLAASLDAARAHARHVWRDTPPVAADRLVNGYIEIPRGERRKFEFNMKANERAIDRVMPDDIGGYPVNYGYVPQTVSYDGDPFDVLVLGPPLPGGRIVPGVIVGLMLMEDEKGLDSKVVTSPVGADGKPRYALTADDRTRIANYFKRYKLHEPGKHSTVPGWGNADDGRAHVAMTHAFFLQCRTTRGAPCRVDRPAPLTPSPALR
jgi:inorganic pyrophosphatase